MEGSRKGGHLEEKPLRAVRFSHGENGRWRAVLFWDVCASLHLSSCREDAGPQLAGRGRAQSPRQGNGCSPRRLAGVRRARQACPRLLQLQPLPSSSSRAAHAEFKVNLPSVVTCPSDACQMPTLLCKAPFRAA